MKFSKIPFYSLWNFIKKCISKHTWFIWTDDTVDFIFGCKYQIQSDKEGTTESDRLILMIMANRIHPFTSLHS